MPQGSQYKAAVDTACPQEIDISFSEESKSRILDCAAKAALLTSLTGLTDLAVQTDFGNSDATRLVELDRLEKSSPSANLHTPLLQNIKYKDPVLISIKY